MKQTTSSLSVFTVQDTTFQVFFDNFKTNIEPSVLTIVTYHSDVNCCSRLVCILRHL